MVFVMVPVHHSGPRTFLCKNCGNRIDQMNEKVYADLADIPFMSYYHQICAQHKVFNNFSKEKT